MRWRIRTLMHMHIFRLNSTITPISMTTTQHQSMITHTWTKADIHTLHHLHFKAHIFPYYKLNGKLSIIIPSKQPPWIIQLPTRNKTLEQQYSSTTQTSSKDLQSKLMPITQPSHNIYSTQDTRTDANKNIPITSWQIPTLWTLLIQRANFF